MTVEHIALWVEDLEMMKNFYAQYFEMTYGNKYTNYVTQFSSYFMEAKAGGARIELMQKPGIAENEGNRGATKGLAHFAFATGSKENVLALTERLRSDGYTIAGEPRTTGDGYFESVVLDPEGNTIEITI
ncbi:MAG: VOC family protein [Bacteroidetes bacterium]|nr:VOC family protein [Bacteroidota bacterium]